MLMEDAFSMKSNNADISDYKNAVEKIKLGIFGISTIQNASSKFQF